MLQLQVKPDVPQGPRGRAVHDPGGGDDILALVQPLLAGHSPDQREPRHGGPSAGLLLRAEAEAGPALARAPPGSNTPPPPSPTSAAAYLFLHSGKLSI